jgi:transposase
MGENITYVGLDVHQSLITVATLKPRARRPEMRIIENDPTMLSRTFKKLKRKKNLRCCYEAGPCGFAVHRHLTRLGIHCDVIAPSLIPKKPGERIKTDRRDAAKLARLYRAGELTAIDVPTAEREAVRDLVRAHEDVRRDMVAARHRLSKFLLRRGIHFSEGRNWTQKWWRWCKALSFEHPEAQATFEHYQMQIHNLLERRAELEAQIFVVAEQEPYKASVERLSCLRGISTLSAMVLVAEIGDFRRFTHPRQLMGFVGLVPSEHSSGAKQRRGGITKTGNGHVRRILVQAAWSYRNPASVGPTVLRLLPGQPPEVKAQVYKAQSRLHARYRRMVGRGKGSKVAIIAVARELCGFIWSLMVI